MTNNTKNQVDVDVQNRCVEMLCHAIITRACVDYQKALCDRGAYDNSRSYPSEPDEVICDVEKFFGSDWFEMMTKVSGDSLLRKLREEAKAGNYKWKRIRKCPDINFDAYV